METANQAAQFETASNAPDINANVTLKSGIDWAKWGKRVGFVLGGVAVFGGGYYAGSARTKSNIARKNATDSAMAALGADTAITNAQTSARTAS